MKIEDEIAYYSNRPLEGRGITLTPEIGKKAKTMGKSSLIITDQIRDGGWCSVTMSHFVGGLSAHRLLQSFRKQTGQSDSGKFIMIADIISDHDKSDYDKYVRVTVEVYAPKDKFVKENGDLKIQFNGVAVKPGYKNDKEDGNDQT